MKENFPIYGIYKTVTTSNEIFLGSPLLGKKKSGSAHELSTLCILPIMIVEEPHSSFVFVSLLKHIDVINSHDIKVLFLVNSD